jgi:hypothetical protein
MIRRSMSWFGRSIVSFRSSLDRDRQNEDQDALSESAERHDLIAFDGF